MNRNEFDRFMFKVSDPAMMNLKDPIMVADIRLRDMIADHHKRWELPMDCFFDNESPSGQIITAERDAFIGTLFGEWDGRQDGN